MGRALGELVDELHPSPMARWELFQNPHAGWPADWPLRGITGWFVDDEAVLEALPLVHPDLPLDDIHTSQLGAYVAGLVHYATIYRESPVGLPATNGVSPELASRLQAIVWDAVLTEPRSGVGI